MELARSRERDLLQRTVLLLKSASRPDATVYARDEAIHFTNKVWSTLMVDLASPDNQLPDELRANIISIGIWILKEAEHLRKADSDDFDGLIEISQLVLDGMR